MYGLSTRSKCNHTKKAAGLFKYVSPFCYHQALKGLCINYDFDKLPKMWNT